MSHSRSSTLVDIDGIDHDDQPVHVRVPGLLVSYCGRRLNMGTHLPPAEVTEPSWCPECVRLQDGL